MSRWALTTAAEMRALDEHTIEALGVPGEVLMESAGRAVAEVALRLLRSKPGEVLVACGTGNNGGDGFVVARHLHVLGVPTRVALVGDPARLTADAAANHARACAAGVRCEVGAEAIAPPLPPAVLVDALLGTGLSRTVESSSVMGRAIAAIERERLRGARVVAVDVPSGLDADTGQVLGSSVTATVTVALGLLKCGLVLEPGRARAGRVTLARIGIPDRAPGVQPRAHWFSRSAARPLVPSRPASGHKGRFGHVLVVAGSEGKTGAAALAARGAARAGAGLVTLACPAGLSDILETLCTEAMTVPVAGTGERGFALAAQDTLVELAAERDVVALGPGIGQSDETRALVCGFVAACDRPLVLDADGLNALGKEASLLRERRAPTVLTPHPGEAGRMLGCTPGEINADRLGAARELASRSGATVVLKGAPTVTVGSDGVALVNATGGPALATGGTGDVLTGVVAALIGQDVEPTAAGALGVWLHGAAGDAVAAARGEAGLLASEVADALPAALGDLREAGTDEPGSVPSLLLDLPDA